METSSVQTSCVNCKKCIPDTEGCYLVLEQNMTVISVINEWVSPQTVTGTDYVCNSCFKLALQLVNMKLETDVCSDEHDAANTISLVADPLKLKTEPPSSDNEETESNHFNNSKQVKIGVQPTVCVDETKINTSCNGETISVKVEDNSCNEYAENNESHEPKTNEPKDSETATNSQDKIEKELALRRGCPICKRSILRRRSLPLSRESPTDVELLTTDMVIANATRETTLNDRVCFVCWQRMRRHALKKTAEMQNAKITNDRDTNVEQNETTLQSIQDPTDPDTGGIPAEKLSKDLDSSAKTSVITEFIILHNYKRAKSTSSKCIFRNCTRKNRHTIKKKLRIELLMHHNYYVPLACRICSFHLVSKNWDLLIKENNSLSSFTMEHIKDIFSMLKTNKSQLDFDDVLSIDEHLFQYWIGMTREKFLSLLNEAPEIQNVHRGVIGLTGLLIKHHRGDSHQSLSRLMHIPRTTLENKMRLVKDILFKRGDMLEAFFPLKTAANQEQSNNTATQTSNSIEIMN